MSEGGTHVADHGYPHDEGSQAPAATGGSRPPKSNFSSVCEFT